MAVQSAGGEGAVEMKTPKATYSEERMGELRLAVEEDILTWPGVRRKLVFGSPGYAIGAKMFAFLTDEGVVVNNITSAEREDLLKRDDVRMFKYGDHPMPKWTVVPLRDEGDVEEAVAWARRSYEDATG